MDFLILIGVAVGLAMDAFAVAVTTSVSLGRVTGRQVFRFAFHFGLFQAGMPLIGWLVGGGVRRYVAAWDHWVAFGLLAVIGAKAIVDALRSHPEPGTTNADLESDVGWAPLRPPQRRRRDTSASIAVLRLRRAQGRPPYIPSAADPTRGWTLLALSVATSIDALAVGLSLSMIEAAIWYPALIIGVVTAGLTVVGMDLGSRIGSRLGRWTELAGGLVLIGIGAKILVEHLS